MSSPAAVALYFNSRHNVSELDSITVLPTRLVLWRMLETAVLLLLELWARYKLNRYLTMNHSIISAVSTRFNCEGAL